jgi:hypothetical protein
MRALPRKRRKTFTFKLGLSPLQKHRYSVHFLNKPLRHEAWRLSDSEDTLQNHGQLVLLLSTPVI